MHGWPIIGRTSEIQRALEALEPGARYRGAVLVGEAGVGKSTLARAIGDNLESTGHVLRRIRGTRTGQAIPLGAFNCSVPVNAAHPPAVMLATAHRILGQQKNLVVIVDDAQWLDPLSAILISQLGIARGGRFVLTIRSGEPVPDAVAALWQEGVLRRLDLEAFTLAQTSEFAHTSLDGPVDSEAVNQLHRLTSGNPLLLRGLMAGALKHRVLVYEGGRWRLEGQLRADAEFDGFVKHHLESLAPDELEVVEIIAAAEVLDWELLRVLCSADAVARTERRGLVQLIVDETHTVARLQHPILAEVVTRLGGVARERELKSLLAQELSRYVREKSGRPDWRTQIRLAQLMLHTHDVPDLDLVTGAAAAAVTMSDPGLGEQLARYAYDSGGGMPAATTLAEAMSRQGRGDEAEELLIGMVPDGGDEAMTVHWSCMRAANLFFSCRQVDAAGEILRAARARASSHVLDPITAMEVSFAFFGGDLPTAITKGLAAVTLGMAPAPTVQAAAATGCALALCGRWDDVQLVAARGKLAATQYDSGVDGLTIGFSEIFMLTATGDLTAADRICERYAALAGDAPAGRAITDALMGRVAYARGQLGPACDALEKSLSMASGRLPHGWAMLVAAWCAQAEAARGNTEAAVRALTEAEHAAGPQVAVFLPELELARAWRRACAGEATTAQTLAERAARFARRSGMHAVEMRALHTAVRFGDRSQSRRLRELRGELGTPLAAVMAAHGHGLAYHDGHRLDDAARQFESMGALAMAADAASHAACEHARTGARMPNLEASTHAHWLASLCDLHSPATTLAANPLPLTDRERETAYLVAAGLTNRQIADRLGVSVRTVDGHLYRIFAKLEIGDRDQLVRLLQNRERLATGRTDRRPVAEISASGGLRVVNVD
ncbi:LuxR C-terminal-related transcriptional regulator [Mycobacterium sp. E2733]|uniref:LuxR C-terminal-related transcriptional regulator n=1 Tax=Mycobacterium sp. E2733 TaxID=1834138 RepID=UPI000AEE1E96